jgi:hypothetical protein
MLQTNRFTLLLWPPQTLPRYLHKWNCPLTGRMQLAAADRSGAASRDFLSLRHESWNHEITLHHAPIVKSSRATLPHLTRQVLIVCLWFKYTLVNSSGKSGSALRTKENPSTESEFMNQPGPPHQCSPTINVARLEGRATEESVPNARAILAEYIFSHLIWTMKTCLSGHSCTGLDARAEEWRTTNTGCVL